MCATHMMSIKIDTCRVSSQKVQVSLRSVYMLGVGFPAKSPQTVYPIRASVRACAGGQAARSRNIIPKSIGRWRRATSERS